MASSLSMQTASGSCSKMAFKIALSAIVLLALCAITEAARRINVQEQMKLRARRSLYEGVEQAVPRVMLGLTQGEELEETTEVKVASGVKKVKFQETYEGLPVLGATLVLEKDAKGHYSNQAVGSLVADLADDVPNTEPQLSVDEAFHAIVLQNRDDLSNVRFDPDLDAKMEILVEEDDTGTPRGRLIYEIAYMVESKDETSRPTTQIDAITGDIIKQWNGLSVNRITRAKPPRVKSASQINGVGGNEKIGKVQYGSKDYPKLKVDNACVLENNVAKVYNCRQNYRCDVSTPFTFDCDEGFDDAVNGAYSPLSDALFYITATYEMFDEWYNIKRPLQRPGTNESMCEARVHYGRSYENAFWDGRYITFGDGASRFYPLTSINVVAHEISHGITQMNSNLQYFGESGGMNEAFSDMAGEAVEFYASKKQDWMVGYEIFKDPEGALRYFSDPTKDGKSIGTVRDYCPGMDPHYSSGLFNRVFYYLGETEGWDVKSAFHPFVVANTLYWKQDSRFYDAACGVVQAAKDLKLNADDVIAAFNKVGVEPCVDTSIGLAATSSISGEAGKEVLIQTKVVESMKLDHMTIKVRGHVTMDVKVISPSCKHCSERVSSYSSKTFEICSTSPGLYQVSITPREEMWGTAVAFYGASVYVVENVTMNGYRSYYNAQFDMPEFVVKNDLQVQLTLTSGYGYVTGYLRYGQAPDLNNYDYDYSLRRNRPTLLCNAKAGTWYLTLKSYDYRAREVAVELQSILTGRKVEPTTPAPEEGSGSGSGETFFV